VEAAQYSLLTLIGVGTALLLLGLAAGLLAGRRSSTAGQRLRETEQRLEQVLQDKQAYEDEVVDHFSETAKLLNNLTEQYREVHNHLARGAGSLCKGRGPVALERLETAGEAHEIPADLVDVRPPLDYAPRSSPDEKGMLNEEFGMERRKPAAPERPPESD